MGNKKEDKTKKKDLPKWTQWVKFFIDSIILIVSIIAILFTKSTLEETRIQRVKSFEPELRLFRQDLKINCTFRNISNPQSSFDYSIYSYSGIFDSTLFKYNSQSGEKFIPWYNSNNYRMPLINVGQSAALDIKTEFELDTIYFLDFFNFLIKDIKGIDEFLVSENMFAIRRLHDTVLFRDLKKPTNNFQYIPQYSSNQDTFLISLPITYFKLLTLRSLLCSKVDGEKKYKGQSISDHHNDIPTIKVKFKYTDINGIEYISSSECYFNGCEITIAGGRDVSYSGDFSVKFIKKEILQ